MAEQAPADIAIWKPFSGKSQRDLQQDIVCVHTMVGSLAGSWDWANQAGNPYWHFGVAGWGECWQGQGLEWQSAANLYGNPYVIPIETADMGQPFGAWSTKCGDVPAWTDAQLEKLVDLISWLCARFDIPPVLIPDTQAGRRGLAYHRLGINPWRINGLLWSLATGKCCPDWRRIAQFIQEVIPAVAARIKGLNEGDEFDMATIAELQKVVRAENGRALQVLALGRSNQAYDLSKDPWDKAVTLPKLLLSADNLSLGEQMQLVVAVKNALDGPNPVLRSAVKGAVAEVLGEAVEADIDADAVGTAVVNRLIAALST